jgi:hypothetical protein
MQRNNTYHPGEAKRLARQKYTERQIDKWIKWSWEIKGKIKFKELVEQQNKYGMVCL